MMSEKADTGKPTNSTFDAVNLLAQLTIDDVRARLDALEDERRALLSLLRSLHARARSAARRQGGGS